MPFDVNLIAVIVVAIVYMVLGFLWYGPFFGKPWMKLMGMKEADMKKDKKNMSTTLALSFVGALVMAYVLGFFVNLAGAADLMSGAKVGFWAWLGFVATTGANAYLYNLKPRSWNLYLIDQAYLLVALKMGGAILATM